MEGQGDGRHNGPNCYRIPLPIGNGARNMETLGLRVFILNQEIIFSIHAMIRPPDNNDDNENDGNTEENDEDENIEDNEEDNEDNIEDEENIEDIEGEENIEDNDNENIEDEEEEVSEESDGDADVEDNDGEMEDHENGAHHEYHADNNNMNDMHMNDENAVLLFRIRVRPLQHGDVFDDIFLELRLVNNDDFDEIDNNEEQNGELNEDSIEDEQNLEEDEDFENVVNDDVDEDSHADECNNDEGFEDIDNENENLEGFGLIGNIVNDRTIKTVNPEVYQDLEEPLPGPSRDRSIEEEDDETKKAKQFQWWDDSNSDSLSDNVHEEDNLHRLGASKQNDDADLQDDKGGKKTRKKNFISHSEDEDLTLRTSGQDADEELLPELSRKRPRAEGGLASETGRVKKRFRHGNNSDSDLEDVQQDSRPASSKSFRNGQEEETRDSENNTQGRANN
ncbi:uncharacterized protein LOC144211640 [Stigmatopora nigra]